jgi:peptidoglycan/LPS O-acetylase OafA/YrhL
MAINPQVRRVAMATAPRISRSNNFDLIRLAAAGQVAVLHGVEHLNLRLPFHDVSLAILECFPGVPIFFLISGFLIASSYERQSLPDFARNRALRIFPALWGCLAVSIASVWASGYFAETPPPETAAVWLLAQVSIGQFYNPEFLRDYGVGVLNGSLWTIPVEIQFYALAPFVVLAFRRAPRLFWGALSALVAVNLVHGFTPDTMVRKLVAVTFLPWIYMFMLGAALQFFWPSIRHWFEGKFGLWLAGYAAIVLLDVTIGIGASTNKILMPYVLVLAGLVLSAAYSSPELAERLLRRNDISYGVYIYHMPVYNFVLYNDLGWEWAAVAVAVLCATVSWKLVEKPALALKNRRTAKPASVAPSA